MKKYTRKTKFILLCLLCAALIFAGLTGCTKKEGDAEAPEGPSAPAAPAKDPAEAAKEAMESFRLTGGTVSCPKGLLGLDPAKEYDLMELEYAIGDYVGDQYVPVKLSEHYYSYIDCGLDGVPELAIKMDYQPIDGNPSGPWQQFVVIRNGAKGLELVAEDYDFYRVQAMLSSSGLISSSGSSGANVMNSDTRFVDAEGNEIFVYSLEFISALKYPIVPYYYIPSALLPDSYPEQEYTYDDSINLEIINFEPYDDAAYTQESMEKHNEKNIYCFYDNNGYDVMLEQGYVDLYDALGLKVVNGEELHLLLLQQYESTGYSQDIEEAPMVEWESMPMG